MIEVLHVERAVEFRTPDAIDVILLALEALERGEGFSDVVAPADGYARLAAALASLLNDPATTIPPATRARLPLYAGLAANLFAAGPQGNAGAVLAALHPDGLPADPETLARYLMLLGPDAPGPVEVADLFALPPPNALLAALNFVAGKPVLTPLGEARRAAVLDPGRRAGRAGGAADAERALAPHQRLDELQLWPGARQARPQAGAEHGLSRPRRTPGAGRPCGAPSRRASERTARSCWWPPRSSSRTTCSSAISASTCASSGPASNSSWSPPRQQVSPGVPELFDRVFTFDPRSGGFLGEIVRFAAGVRPDLVFWPSVGMARWGPLLANLRLAPIQLTALGHSASTFIPAMDYYLTEQGYVGDPSCFQRPCCCCRTKAWSSSRSRARRRPRRASARRIRTRSGSPSPATP